MSKKVLIVGGNGEYRRMFESVGSSSLSAWEVTGSLLVTAPDLVQFTGGEDVTPWLYGEPTHRTTHYNFGRDMREIEVFGHCLERGIPMAGICRGGQFLNVMCGGKMWQHVDGHAVAGTHKIQDVETGEEFQATSTHHQMMRPGKGGKILGIALPRRSTFKEDGMGRNGVLQDVTDTEIVFYPEQKVLCFQPHPEFAGHDELRDRYFGYLSTYLGV